MINLNELTDNEKQVLDLVSKSSSVYDKLIKAGFNKNDIDREGRLYLTKEDKTLSIETKIRIFANTSRDFHTGLSFNVQVKKDNYVVIIERDFFWVYLDDIYKLYKTVYKRLVNYMLNNDEAEVDSLYDLADEEGFDYWTKPLIRVSSLGRNN